MDPDPQDNPINHANGDSIDLACSQALTKRCHLQTRSSLFSIMFVCGGSFVVVLTQFYHASRAEIRLGSKVKRKFLAFFALHKAANSQSQLARDHGWLGDSSSCRLPFVIRCLSLIPAELASWKLNKARVCSCAAGPRLLMVLTPRVTWG